MKGYLAAIVVPALLLLGAPASALTLITAEEAALPAGGPQPLVVPVLPQRGITRPPEIDLVAPPKRPVHSPFEFRIGFVAHGGAHIDPKSVKITYLRQDNIDLTNRLQMAITAKGIDVPNAETPPGQYAFRIEVRDDDGHISATDIVITVTP
jgi:hypothetical protein